MDPFFLLKIQILLQKNPRDLQKWAEWVIMLCKTNTIWNLTDRIKEFTRIFAKFGQIFMLRFKTAFETIGPY